MSLAAGRPATAKSAGVCIADDELAAGDARVDDSCAQSREVWTGTSYALAAAMLLEHATLLQKQGVLASDEEEDLDGLWAGAFEVVWGIREGGWGAFGHWFATPEAWEATGNFRSLGHARALAIWSMQWAFTRMSDKQSRQSCPEPCRPRRRKRLGHDMSISTYSSTSESEAPPSPTMLRASTAASAVVPSRNQSELIESRLRFWEARITAAAYTPRRLEEERRASGRGTAPVWPEE
eukprot:gnl/TRDRNA2_/TRDRNA2_118073_c1_seq1.p1 gnl/TRDRNA2_/TRDRNA2_118073_c1~~gnl/TRDRNA2_/TRDRNA2_118073_c1_seq1.p1  ORF type:complete len:247 (-),score=36.88 gnl/TRDRNA2_/TRDRNA2_118073_c1_seq1:108-818(-)